MLLELKKEKLEESAQNKTVIHKLELQAKEHTREIQLLERQRKNLQSKLENYKEKRFGQKSHRFPSAHKQHG